jgi:hypothetical protein
MITGTFNKIPRKKNSHGYGFARTWSENLSVDINHDGEYTEVLYLDHGVNFGGSLNLFSGFNEDLEKRINNFLQANVIYSLDIDMPDYGAMLKKRKDVKDKEWCDKISDKCAQVKPLKSTDLFELPWLTIGDSHTAAYAPHNSMVIKTDGLTLNGQINNNFEYVRSHMAECDPKGITMSFGNIDIRHHVCRLNVDIREMLQKWKEFGDSLGIPVEYSTPWPIETEERRLPKTGYYKDKPFWGTRWQRMDAVTEWTTTMDELGMQRVKYPEEWLLLNGERYAKEKMESVSSVHLSPEVYRRKEWGNNHVQLSDFMV